jgi:hypothetical protein
MPTEMTEQERMETMLLTKDILDFLATKDSLPPAIARAALMQALLELIKFCSPKGTSIEEVAADLLRSLQQSVRRSAN